MATEHQKRSMRERLTETKLAVEQAREAWLAYRGEDEVREAHLRSAYWKAEAILLRMLLSWAEHSTQPKPARRAPARLGTSDAALAPMLIASIMARREKRAAHQGPSSHHSLAISLPLRRKRP